MNVAEFILAQLAAWGVRHIYGVTGDAILPFMDAVSRQKALRYIPVRHESAAGFMASTEAKLTGRPALCISTSGPGLANLINGLGDAFADRAPLLVISGQVETYKLGTDVKQYIDQQVLLSSLAGYTSLLAGAGATPRLLTRALKSAIGQGQVAHISVPKDIWNQPVQGEIFPPQPYLTAPPVVAEASLSEAAARLRQARRPLILAGHGAREVAEEILALAKAWDAGIIVALGGKGLIPGDHPNVLGGLGDGGSNASHQALAEADMLLVVGSTWWPQPYMPSHLRVVQVDRAATNIGGQTPVEYGLPGDAVQVIPALLSYLTADSGEARGDWHSKLLGYKESWQSLLRAEASARVEGAVHPAVLGRAVAAITTPETVVTLDTGDHLLWFNRHFEGKVHRILFSGTWRSMGYALPAASAAKLCLPDARVIALVGDGGLSTVLGELAIPVQEKLDLTVVVARNNVLALEENKARKEGLQPFGHTLVNPDFAALAAAFGWRSRRVATPNDLDQALAEAVTTVGPALVEVLTVNDPQLHMK